MKALSGAFSSSIKQNNLSANYKVANNISETTVILPQLVEDDE